MACDPQKPMNFQLFAYARRRQPRSKEYNRGQIITQKKDPTYVKKQQTKAHFEDLGWGVPKKSKNDLLEPPRGPQGGEKCDPKWVQDAPRGPQDGPKSPLFNFQTPLFRPERPSEAALAPKTPQEDSRGPPGGRNLTCGASFGTHGRRFS